ncbi:sortase B protein-sorting domain-containing protein [Christensenellaceae bacterium OttesenSCG-928-K19]|nr:sortase B protein-sorting domain-containing protein [Christensenellaceae bacterium OttesenSCG-928-K19]
MLTFPSMQGYDAQGAEYNVPVAWACDAWDKDAPGTYTFAVTLTDEAAYKLAGGVLLPGLTVKVEEQQQPTEVAGIDALAEDEITVPFGTAKEDIPFPVLHNGGAELGGAVWACDGYDGETAGEYVFTPSLPKEKYTLASGITLPAVTVTVEVAQIAAQGGIGILAATDYTYSLDSPDTVTNIESDIQDILDNDCVPGGTVTVTGEKTDANARLSLDIPAGVTVIWQATWKGAELTHLIDLVGAGTFEVKGGTVENTGGGSTIGMDSDGSSVKVTGGTVKGVGGHTIVSNGENQKINMTDGVISGGSIIMQRPGTEITLAGGSVTATGNAITATGANGIVDISGSATVTAGGSAVDVRGANCAVNISDGGSVSGNSMGIINDAVTGSIEVTGGSAGIESRGGSVTVESGSVTGNITAIFIKNSGTVDAVGGNIISTNGPAVMFQDATGTLKLGGAALSWANGNSVLDVSGNPNTPQTVTVEGAMAGAAAFPMRVNPGQTIKWKASYLGNTAGALVPVTGNGGFELAGGYIANTAGPAIAYTGTGSANVTDGLALGRGTVLTDVVPNAPTDNGMVVAWATPGQKQYIPGTDEDLAVFPYTVAAQWEASASKNGVRYDNGQGNTGLVPIDVTVSSIYDVIVNFQEVRDNTIPASCTIDAPYKHFANGGYVEVNKKLLKEGTDYTHKEGSTVITLTPAYLQTLKNDTYTMDVYFANGGKASTPLHVLVLGLFTIKATAGDHGTITPSGDVQVTETHNQTFDFTPDAGYVVDTVTVDGVAVTPVNNSYTFEAVSKNSTIHVTFKSATGAGVTRDGTSPKTGDAANMSLYIALCMIAGVSIMGVVAYRRKKRKQQ